jgi:hypothetical protein
MLGNINIDEELQFFQAKLEPSSGWFINSVDQKPDAHR